MRSGCTRSSFYIFPQRPKSNILLRTSTWLRGVRTCNTLFIEKLAVSLIINNFLSLLVTSSHFPNFLSLPVPCSPNLHYCFKEAHHWIQSWATSIRSTPSRHTFKNQFKVMPILPETPKYSMRSFPSDVSEKNVLLVSFTHPPSPPSLLSQKILI